MSALSDIYIWHLKLARPWIGVKILISIEPPPLTQEKHQTLLSDVWPRSVPTLELISRAASSVGVMYRCQWSQHREQSQRRADKKKLTKPFKSSYRKGSSEEFFLIHWLTLIKKYLSNKYINILLYTYQISKYKIMFPEFGNLHNIPTNSVELLCFV